MNASTRDVTNSVKIDCKMTPLDDRVMDGKFISFPMIERGEEN